MIWLILIAWIILSVPFALLCAAFIKFGDQDMDLEGSGSIYELEPEVHSQTFVG